MGTAKGRYRGKEAAAIVFPRFIQAIPRVGNWRDASCVTWPSAQNRDGYPLLWWNSKQAIASRVAFFLTRGHYPKNLACHLCNNSQCVHPDHLYDGTTIENIRDRVQSKGYVDGDRVKDLRRNGVTCCDGAQYLGISRAHFSRLSRGLGQKIRHAFPNP